MASRSSTELRPRQSLPKKTLREFCRQSPPSLRAPRLSMYPTRPRTTKPERRAPTPWVFCPRGEYTGDFGKTLGGANAASEQPKAEFIVFSVNKGENVEMKQAIEKCVKWMEGLPAKFSGLNDLLPPVNYEVGDKD